MKKNLKLAPQLGSLTVKTTVLFFSSENSYRETSVKAYIYLFNVFF